MISPWLLGTCCARHELVRHGRGLRANDGAHELGPVTIVLGVVGGVDGGVHVRGRLGERHLLLQTTGPDATHTAGLRAAEPRSVRAVPRSARRGRLWPGGPTS